MSCFLQILVFGWVRFQSSQRHLPIYIYIYNLCRSPPGPLRPQRWRSSGLTAPWVHVHPSSTATACTSVACIHNSRHASLLQLYNYVLQAAPVTGCWNRCRPLWLMLLIGSFKVKCPPGIQYPDTLKSWLYCCFKIAQVGCNINNSLRMY